MKYLGRLLILSAATAAAQSTFQVTNVNATGAGSLRQAVTSANANADASSITFSDGSGAASTSMIPRIRRPSPWEAPNCWSASR